MKRYLIVGAAAACVVAWAARQGASSQPLQPREEPQPKPVSTRAWQSSQAAATPRHLTEAERAELRRQLRQFNREYGKHS
jgi:hypothetical protein